MVGLPSPKRKEFRETFINYNKNLPCPARTSIRTINGRPKRFIVSPNWYCNCDIYLNECAGITRSSWSAVVRRIAGYIFEFVGILCNGDIDLTHSNSSGISGFPYSPHQ
jgi:hypothetical protein